MPEADVPNSGICVKTAAPKPSVDYYKAYAAFNAADADHSGTISFGGAYQVTARIILVYNNAISLSRLSLQLLS